MELLGLKSSFSAIFQIISAVAGFLSIWIKLTIESNVNKTLNEFKREMDDNLDRKFVQINQLKADLSFYITRDQHSNELNYLKSVTEKSQQAILDEIRKVADGMARLSSKFEAINTAFEYENKKSASLEKDISKLKEALYKWKE